MNDHIRMDPKCPRCGGKHGVEVAGDGYDFDCAACGGRITCAIGPDGGEMYPWDDDDDDEDEAADRPLLPVSGRKWPSPGVYVTDRCVLGATCCCPHVDHGPDECHTAEMAEQFHGAVEPCPAGVLDGHRQDSK